MTSLNKPLGITVVTRVQAISSFMAFEEQFHGIPAEPLRNKEILSGLSYNIATAFDFGFSRQRSSYMTNEIKQTLKLTKEIPSFPV